MKTIPSSEFRKQYVQLTEVTIVEVHGRPLGTWHPIDRLNEVIEDHEARLDRIDRALEKLAQRRAKEIE